MVADLLRKQVYRPEALRLLLADVLGRRHPVLSTSRHLDETAQWILRAQAATRDHGVSGGYTFEDGWLASYPEVTGYIIPTLLTYAAVVGRLDPATSSTAPIRRSSSTRARSSSACWRPTRRPAISGS